VSNALEIQLFLGLPVEEIELAGKNVEDFGLEIHNAGANMSDGAGNVREFIGKPVGLSVSWDGLWSDEVGVEELEKIRGKVVEGFGKIGVMKKPKLFWLSNFY